MKIYRQHGCTRNHRTYRTLAECMFRRAEWVVGEGEFASLAWCGVLTVELHPTEESALQAKANIDKFACGHRCYKKHEVIRLVKAP